MTHVQNISANGKTAVGLNMRIAAHRGEANSPPTTTNLYSILLIGVKLLGRTTPAP